MRCACAFHLILEAIGSSTTVDPVPPPIIQRYDFRSEAALQEKLTAWQVGFDLAHGPLLAAGIVENHPDGRQRILLAVHHLAVDIVSWRVLLDELRHLLDDPEADLPPPTAGFAHWVHALARLADEPPVKASLPHWTAALRSAGTPLPVQGEATRSTTVRLDADTTRGLLQELAHAYSTRVHELILAALAPALAHGLDAHDVALMLEGHGREDVVGLDVSSTIGWFTTRFPVRFELPAGTEPEPAIVAVKEQLRAVPHNGLGYGVLRELSPDPATRTTLALAEPEITFNYLGRLDGLGGQGWALAPEPPGAMVSPHNRPAARLDVTAFVLGGQLETRITTDLPAPWVDSLAADFLDRLHAVVAHCRSRQAIRYTPSDFPEAGLPTDELARALLSRAPPADDVYQLTPLQEGLLFHALHSPASDQYVVQFEWRCAAAIEPELLHRAWAELVAAHDILRTRFAWRGLSHPVQIVQAEAPLAWRVADLSGRDGDAAEAAIAAERAAERAPGFDLERPGALRVALLRQRADRWVLLWTYHHILLDGWCVPLLLDELGRRYDALRHGHALHNSPPPSYRAYIGWLRHQDREQALRFWRGELQGLTGPTDIPVRLPGTAFDAHAPMAELGVAQRALDVDLSRRLGELARREGVTLNAVIQLAWACLLGGYAGGMRDVVFGTIVSGRANSFPEVERLVGLAANVVPIRARLDPGVTVATALRTLHATIEAAGDHSYLSLAEIRAVSELPADAPLFHSVTVFENYPSVGAGSEALGAMAASVHDKTSFPLLLMVLPGESLQLTLHYDAALFAAPTMAALAAHLANLLRALAGSRATGRSHRAGGASRAGMAGRDLQRHATPGRTASHGGLAVRRASGPHARSRGGRGRCRPNLDLCRARRRREPAGAPVACPA